MANMGCTGNHPKHLFGDDVARNHSLSSEEESCRLDGETLCLLQKFCAISDKAEQKVVFSNIVPSTRVTNTGQEEAKRFDVTSYGLFDSMF